jgi:hypothetical protein
VGDSALVSRLLAHLLLWTVLLPTLAGCLVARGLTEISEHPYRLLDQANSRARFGNEDDDQDDSKTRFGDEDDNVLIEVRRAPGGKPAENLAIHYRSLFPRGEAVRPRDHEEYVEIKGRKAYHVKFQTQYIRKRKRLPKDKPPPDPATIPKGWTVTSIDDPANGGSIPVLQGPVIPSRKILYLVQGDSYVYYILLRADGDPIEPVKDRFEKFVREQIAYR